MLPLSLVVGSSGVPRLAEFNTINMYAEKTPDGPTEFAMVPRPGLALDKCYPGRSIRAVFVWSNVRFVVAGPHLYADDVLIADLPGGAVRWAVSNDEAVIVVAGSAFYITPNGAEIIDDPDLPSTRDVVFLAGRFVYIDNDDSGIYRYSNINDARSIDGLSFSSAEADPDPIVCASVLADGMAIFGTKTTEWHYPSLDPDNPYQRSKGRSYSKGCGAAATVQLSDNVLYFVGSDRIVYKTGQVPKRVSSSAVEDALARQSQEDFQLNTAFSTVFRGHTFYVLNIEGHSTWAYDVEYGAWYNWKSWDKPMFNISVSDGVYLGGADGGVYVWDHCAYIDAENSPIERVVSTWVPHLAGPPTRHFSLTLHSARGVGTLNGPQNHRMPSVELRFSDDLGSSWSVWMEGALGQHGDMSQKSLAHWTSLGSPQSPGRIYEFRCTDPVYFSPFSVVLNSLRA